MCFIGCWVAGFGFSWHIIRPLKEEPCLNKIPAVAVTSNEAGQEKRILILDRHFKEISSIHVDFGSRHFQLKNSEKPVPQNLREGDRYDIRLLPLYALIWLFKCFRWVKERFLEECVWCFAYLRSSLYCVDFSNSHRSLNLSPSAISLQVWGTSTHIRAFKILCAGSPGTLTMMQNGK